MDASQPVIDPLINQLKQEIEEHEQAIELCQRDLGLLEAVRPVFMQYGATVREVSIQPGNASEPKTPATGMEGPPGQSGAPVSLSQRVVSILKANDRVMTPAEIRSEFEKRGWTANQRSLATTLSKLTTQDRVIVRVDVGQYALPQTAERLAHIIQNLPPS